MYIHLGHDYVVRFEDIIGIFDLDTSTVEKPTRNYLRKAEQDGDVITITDALPKSFVICRDEARASRRIIYLSPISTSTLSRRSGNI